MLMRQPRRAEVSPGLQVTRRKGCGCCSGRGSLVRRGGGGGLSSPDTRPDDCQWVRAVLHHPHPRTNMRTRAREKGYGGRDRSAIDDHAQPSCIKKLRGAGCQPPPSHPLDR